jgi:DNA-binding response OmpR family regulator
MSASKIMIVDDEPDILVSLGMRLRANGYKIVSATDGYEATRVALREQPDLVILDMGLPGGSGHAVAEKLRCNPITQEIPIIYLTARRSAEDSRNSIKLRIEKYITKPYESVELVDAVDELLSRSLV